MLKKGFIIVVVLLFLISLVNAAEIESEVEQLVNEKGEAEVVIVLKQEPDCNPSKIMSKDKTEFKEQKKQIIEEKKQKTKNSQEKLLKNLEVVEKNHYSSNPDLKIKEKFKVVNAISGNITKKGLEKLKNNPDVVSVQNEKQYSILLDSSVPVTNADHVWNLSLNNASINGTGQVVCVVDTGIDYTHENLGNCTEAEFLAGNCTKVIGGYDVINGDNNSIDDHGHGTHCAGIVASEHPTYTGAAPGASLIAVKSLSASGTGSSSSIAGGIDWCVDNADAYNISVISMSIGTSGYHSNTYCDSYDSLISAALNSARDAGIIVMVAAGNEATTYGLSSPACMANATPIGASTDADEIASYSNTGDLLTLVAPGSSIYSTKKGGSFETRSGTSMATPMSAAITALLLQYSELNNETLTPEQIEQKLNSTATLIYDSQSDKNYSRIDALSAVYTLDETAPVVNFTLPTPETNTTHNTSVIINITADEEISSALLEWNTTNQSMDCLSDYCYIEKLGSGNYSFKAYASDVAGNYGSTETRNITLNNNAPVIISYYPNSTNVSIAEPGNQTFNITASDENNNTLTYQWYQNGVLQNDSDNIYIFEGSYQTAGNYNISAYVSDSLTNDSYSWNLTVNNTNSAPVFNRTIANQSWKKNLNKTIDLSSYYYDIDNDNLTYNSTVPANITVNINNSIATLVPDTNFTGNNSIIFYAFDAEYNASSNNITLTITENNAPVLGNLSLTCSDSDNTTNGNLLADFDYYDADNDSKASQHIKWYVNSTHNSSYENSTSISSSNTEKGQVWMFSARAYDNYSWSSWYNSSNITIKNSAPVLETITDQEVEEGDTVSIDADADDIDNDDLTYDIDELDSSDFEQDNDDFEWETESGDEGVYEINISVTDGNLTDWQIVEIEVNEPEDDDDSGSSGGSSGGSAGTTTTTTTTSGIKDNQVFSYLSSGKNTINLNKDDIPFVKYEFSLLNKRNQVTITTELEDSRPGYAPAPSNNVYKYVSLSVTIPSSELEDGVDYEFKIPKSWFSSYDKDSVKLLRYYDNQWNQLPTSYLKETTADYHYTAHSPGFSLYAITAETKKQQPVERTYETMSQPEPKKVEKPAPKPKPQPSNKTKVVGKATQEENNKTSIIKGEELSSLLWVIIAMLVCLAVVIAFRGEQLKEKIFHTKPKTKTKARLSKLKKTKRVKQPKTKPKKSKPKKPEKVKTKVKVVTVKKQCPKCGSKNIARGFGGEYFCKKCGEVIKTDY